MENDNHGQQPPGREERVLEAEISEEDQSHVKRRTNDECQCSQSPCQLCHQQQIQNDY